MILARIVTERDIRKSSKRIVEFIDTETTCKTFFMPLIMGMRYKKRNRTNK